MNKEKNKLIPELRFPEFINEDRWSFIKIEDLIDQYVEKSDFTNQYPVLTSSREGIMFQRDYYNRDIASSDNSGYNVVPRGYFTYRHMSDDLIFKFNINTICDRGIVSTLYPVFSANEEKILPFFLQQKLNEGTEFRNFANSQKQGGSRTYMYLSKLKELKLLVPNLPEQQKIADCLSSLDELLTAHRNKIETLKIYKKGLMQNLFPQEGEKVPKLRFREFKKDGEWKKKKLGNEEVATFVNKKISIENLRLDNYVSTENMLPDFTGITTALKIPSTGSFTKFSPGDILISNIRPYLKKVWKASFEGGSSNDVLVFRAGSEVLSDYLEYLIKNEDFIDYIMKSVQGVKMPRGNKDSMKEYSVMIPTKNEQKHISLTLSSLDNLIHEQTNKIEHLKSHKKGLIQGLFPKVNN